jgi:hypothetical protein
MPPRTLAPQTNTWSQTKTRLLAPTRAFCVNQHTKSLWEQCVKSVTDVNNLNPSAPRAPVHVNLSYIDDFDTNISDLPTMEHIRSRLSLGQVFEDRSSLRMALDVFACRARVSLVVTEHASEAFHAKNRNSVLTYECFSRRKFIKDGKSTLCAEVPAAYGQTRIQCGVQVSARFDWRTNRYTICHSNLIHTCGGLRILETSRALRADFLFCHSVQWVSKQIMNGEVEPKHLKSYLETHLQISIPPMQVYRVLQKSVNVILGDVAEQVTLVPRFLELIKDSNVGTYNDLAWNPDNRNHLVGWAICIGACVRCVRYGIPFLSVDAAHLKGRARPYGKMFLAVGSDFNRRLIPVAMGIYQEETAEAWGSFLRLIQKGLQRAMIDPAGVTFMSDRGVCVCVCVCVFWFDEN